MIILAAQSEIRKIEIERRATFAKTNKNKTLMGETRVLNAGHETISTVRIETL